MTGGSGLGELVAARAAAIGDVERAEVESQVEYRHGGRPFAVVSGYVLEVHLGPAVAAAALRTPDVTPSTRGADWVSFGPATLDEYASDRAAAWFDAARRRADRTTTGA